MQGLIQTGNLVSAPIEEGDAGIILKRDGTFRIFSTGKIDADNLTEAQREQGERLIALSTALRHEQVMDVLKRIAADPAVTGPVLDVGATN